MAAQQEIIRLETSPSGFGGVTALNDVSFSMAKGEVHAVVGENGAGKSTLMKILAGVHSQDTGHIVLSGTPVTIRVHSTHAAKCQHRFPGIESLP